MDVPLDENPPPAYGEPLPADQFDAKIQQGVEASAQAPQPHDHWQTWDDATFTTNAALLSPASSSTPSVLPSPQTQSPRLAESCSLPIAALATQQKKQRQLPQIPPAPLARHQSKRDRKPPGGARPIRHSMSEGMARKQAEYLASAPLWQAQPRAQVSSGSATSSSAVEEIHVQTPPATGAAPRSPPPPSGVPLSGLSLPTVAEVEERNASLFGDNNAWRRNGPDDEVPPPFAPVAPALGDAHLEEAMAELRLQFAAQRGHVSGASPVTAESPDARTRVPAPESDPISTSSDQPVTSDDAPVQAPYIPQSALSEKMALSTAMAAQEQFDQSSSSSAPTSSQPSTAPAHFRYSAPPAPIRVAPSPASSPTPDELGGARSASAVVPASAMSRAQSATAKASQSRYPSLLRFNPKMIYEENSTAQKVVTNPADFYSASVSSTMGNGSQRPIAQHRTSAASYTAVTPASAFAPFAYPSSMYGPAATPSLNQSYYAPGTGQQDTSSVRSASPPPRNSSPFSMRGGVGPPLGTLGMIDRSGAGNPGALDSMLARDAGGNPGYDAERHALFYQHALQQPQISGGSGLQRHQSAQAPAPTQGGYYPNVPPPPPISQQVFQPRPTYPPQQPSVFQQQQQRHPVSSGAPQPPWASAPLQAQTPITPRPPLQQGMYPPPPPQQQGMPYTQYQPQAAPQHQRLPSVF